MADNMMYALMGAIGLLALLAFLQRPEQIAYQAPPSKEVQEQIWAQIETPQGISVMPTIPTNACGATRFAYPDFSGTPRVGQGCVDSLDCQNHPPVGFPNYQECCPADGTCFTRD